MRRAFQFFSLMINRLNNNLVLCEERRGKGQENAFADGVSLNMSLQFERLFSALRTIV